MKTCTKILLNFILFFSLFVFSGNMAKALPTPLPGNALKFDGVNDYVDFGTTNLGNFDSGFTFETWVKWDSLNYGSSLFDFSYYGSYKLSIGNYQRTDSLYINIYTYYNMTLTVPDVIDTSVWMHIAVTNGSNGVTKVYVNGVVKMETYTSTLYNPGSRNYCYVGRSSNSYFKGKLDEMRIWNTERSEANILAYINDTVARNSANLKMYYRFDEGSGTTLLDTSLNTFNGTLKNFDITKAWIASYAIIQPILKPISKLTNISFKVNWAPVATATSYSLSVDDASDFSSPLAAYNNLNVGNVTTYAVSGLSPTTTYYYRINSSGSRTSLFSKGAVMTLAPNMTIPGNSLNFDGTNDYVNCGKKICLNNKSFTIEFWAKKPVVTDTRYVMGYGNASSNNLSIGFNSSNVFLRYGYSNISVNYNNDTLWHHYAFIFDNNTGDKSIYIDGKLAISMNIESANNALGEFYIGKIPGSSSDYYSGQLDEMRIWSGVRSENQIIANMNDTVDQDSPGLMSYWKFDMVTGSAIVPDHSPFSNTGTLEYMAVATAWKSSFAIIQPVIKSSTNITLNSFKLNWYQVADASTTYYIDVDDNIDFSSPLVGYNNLSVGAVTSYSVTGLTSGKIYYSRVRSNSTKLSYNSIPARTLTLVNPISAVTPGNALKLSNLQEYVNCGDSIKLNNQSFTIEFWAKLRDFEGGYVFSQGKETNNSMLFASIYQDYISIGNYNDYFDILINTDTCWHHYAYMYDQSTLERSLYRDGTLLAIQNSSTYSGSGTFYIGTRMNYLSNNFNGELDEMRIWSGTRSAENLLNYMNDTVDRHSTGLKAYWRFDTIANCPQVIIDYSSNKNNAIIEKIDSYKDFSKSFAIIQPVLKSATGISYNNFTVNWNQVHGATSYYLTVDDTSDFSSPLTGYNNLNVGNVTTYSVTGLNPSTIYYYRVGSFTSKYSEKSSGQIFTKAPAGNMITPGKAVSFDGVDDYIDCGDNIDISNQSFTIEFWAKMASVDYGYVLSQGINQSQAFYLSMSSAGLQISINNNWLQANFTQDTGWHHYAFSYDNVNQYFYIYRDGMLSVSQYENLNYTDTGKFFIGRSGCSNYDLFNGKLDEIRIWGNKRTHQEIITNMNDTVDKNSTGLKAYYRFDSPGNVNVFADYSTNGNSAGLINMDVENSIVESYAIIQPIMKPVNNVTDTCFTINWHPVAHATNYYLDIDDNKDFSSPIVGYSNLNVGNVSQYTVTFPRNTFSYYCRVRSKISKSSQNSSLVQAMSPHGNALSFDGSSDYVYLPDNDSLDLTSNYTIEAWIKPNVFKYHQGIIRKGYGGYSLLFSNSGNYRGLEFDGMSTDDNILDANQWYHIAAVNDSGTRHLYVNGIEQTLSGSPNTIYDNNDGLYIGDYYSFSGVMDEVRIWKVAHSIEEVNYFKYRTLKGSENGLAAYFNFDAGIAAGNNLNYTNISNVSDSKSQANLFNFELNGSASNFVASDIKNVIGSQGVITTGITSINIGSATISAEIFDKGSANATERGVCYGTTKVVSVGSSRSFEKGSFGNETYSISLTGLSPNVTYYARAYSVNPDGISYGNLISFDVPGFSNDMEICEIFSDGMPFTASEKLSIVIKNKGNNVQTTVPVTFLLNGNLTSETYTGNLNYNETDTFTFAQKIDLSTPAVVKIKASVVLPGDENSANDTLTGQFAPLNVKSIGTGAITGRHLPIEPNYGFSYSQSIYLKSELGDAQYITCIAFDYKTSAGYEGLEDSKNWKIYLANTSKNNFSSSTDWININDYTLVFDDTITNPTASGWIYINIAPFYYDGTGNLAIAVEEDKPNFDDSSDDFNCSSVLESRSIYNYNDWNNPDPSSPPQGTITNYIPNVKFFSKLNQSITFNPFANPVTYGDASFAVSATGGSSINPVIFSSSDNSIATCTGINGKTVNIIGAGTCTIFANQAGNSAYAPAQVGLILTVNKRAISITASANQSKIYRGSEPAYIYSYTPALLSGDAFTGKLSRAAGENVGLYAINLGTLSAGNNYEITFTGSDFTITPKALTVKVSRVYDGTTAVTITGAALSGVVGNDNVTLENVTSGTFADANVGTDKSITAPPMTIIGTAAGNYTLVLSALKGDITKAELTVTATNKSRCVNTANPTFDYTYSGFVNGETSSIIDTLPVATTIATQSSITGTYPITVSGGADNNYSFKYTDGQLTINTQVTPVITVDNTILHSDAATGNQWYNDNGLINGATSQDYTATAPGNYYVVVTTPGCSSESSNKISIINVSINSADFRADIYPNPVLDVLQISIDDISKEAIYCLYSLTGGKLIEGKLIEGKALVDMEKYSSGTYILRITSDVRTNEYKIIKK